MDRFFEMNGYTFKAVKSTNPQRPFKVRCLQTLEEKDSAMSYEDAISLLLTPKLSCQAKLDEDSQNIEYVKNVFSILIGKKKSECDEIVENDIANRGLIKGTIYSIKEKERFQVYKEYKTENFLITVHFENGLMRGCTRIDVARIPQ